MITAIGNLYQNWVPTADKHGYRLNALVLASTIGGAYASLNYLPKPRNVQVASGIAVLGGAFLLLGLINLVTYSTIDFFTDPPIVSGQYDNAPGGGSGEPKSQTPTIMEDAKIAGVFVAGAVSGLKRLYYGNVAGRYVDPNKDKLQL